jgi:phage host-nuclease inhibitor protein Gam
MKSIKLQEEVRKQKEDIQKKDDELKGKVDHICYLQKKVKIYETMIAILMTEMREKLLNESSDERRGQITEHYTSRIEGLKNEIKKVKRDYYKAVRERTPSKERDAIRCIHKEVLCNRCISKIYNDTTSSSCQIQ